MNNMNNKQQEPERFVSGHRFSGAGEALALRAFRRWPTSLCPPCFSPCLSVSVVNSLSRRIVHHATTFTTESRRHGESKNDSFWAAQHFSAAISLLQ